MATLRQKWWSPYLVGVLIGVLSWIAFATADKPLGITTAFEYTAAIGLQAAAPAVEATNGYFSDPDKSPKIDWEWMLVLGVFIGSFLSSRLSGDRPVDGGVPPAWASRFGASRGRRYFAAFFGAAVMIFGARLAQGCTSGHGISGALQLAVSSWIFIAVFVTAAVATAAMLYRPKE